MGDLYGAVEAGGTKFVCLVGTGPDDVRDQTRFPTADSPSTLARAVRFFTDFTAANGAIDALGIASFGPVELRTESPRYGSIGATPKPGWSGTDVVAPFRDALGIPIGFDNDVNGALLAEGRWGAAQGLETFVYLTVGTGIGGAAQVEGDVVHGLVHPEMGHISLPRQPGDTHPGSCPFHGACWEGLASGPALGARFGRRPEDLTGDDLERAVELEAGYLATGVRSIVYTLAPQRVVIGGGLSSLPGLFPRIRSMLSTQLAGYPGLPEYTDERFVVPAALGPMAGPAGALLLAQRALAGR